MLFTTSVAICKHGRLNAGSFPTHPSSSSCRLRAQALAASISFTIIVESFVDLLRQVWPLKKKAVPLGMLQSEKIQDLRGLALRGFEGQAPLAQCVPIAARVPLYLDLTVCLDGLPMPRLPLSSHVLVVPTPSRMPYCLLLTALCSSCEVGGVIQGLGQVW